MKIILQLLLIICMMLLSCLSNAQIKSYSFEQIDSLQKREQRDLVIFISTDWCKHCHSMKNTTFKNKDIITLLNSEFYFAELNGEEKREIIFRGHHFYYKPTGNNTGIHELVEELGTINKKVTYPILCFLNTNNEIIFQYNQYLSANELLPLLQQFKKSSTKQNE